MKVITPDETRPILIKLEEIAKRLDRLENIVQKEDSDSLLETQYAQIVFDSATFEGTQIGHWNSFPRTTDNVRAVFNFVTGKLTSIELIDELPF